MSTRPTLDERISRERAELALKPWELAPSEAGDGESPWPVGTTGHAGWLRAQQLRAEILERDPAYFDDDPEGTKP